ncbi:hypothetical protein BFX40_02130 [Mesorhizobium sp. SEMIA 3007]|uniref:hypothetical protein n=1 Tax=Mesorhizobium sp. 131-3-5 TaxID=2744520 RepID=UPI00068777B3|nr:MULTISPECIES: hypothetical protein [Mesorhizobium]ANN56402.1 hypothetical protein A9174_06170 [Mesorhizobium loti NZP2037]ODA91802.1 hypothetical protein BFX40_02130 [Mesorhizobium sp. SEMIA 3007]
MCSDRGRAPVSPEGAGSFFRSRWLGQVPIDRLFWRDMLLVGTGISIASSVVALILLGLKMPLGLVLAVHFAPVPYNIFLTIAVWRTAEKSGAKASLMLLGSALWLIATVVI